MQTLTAEFLGKEVTLVDNNGVAYVAMREIVEGIGLDWKGQHKKLMEQSEKFNCGHITTVAKDGKNREMLCIPIKKLNGWLFGLNPNKVRADLKERLENYQEECFLALWGITGRKVSPAEMKSKTSWHCGNKRKPNILNVLVNGENYCSNANQKSKTLSVSFYKLNS